MNDLLLRRFLWWKQFPPKHAEFAEGHPILKLISIDLYLIYEEWLNCWNMTDILYKRLSDETIGACIEVHKLMGLILVKNDFKKYQPR